MMVGKVSFARAFVHTVNHALFGAESNRNRLNVSREFNFWANREPEQPTHVSCSCNGSYRQRHSNNKQRQRHVGFASASTDAIAHNAEECFVPVIHTW